MNTPQIQDWISYWENERSMSSALWKAHAKNFTSNLLKEFAFDEKSTLLDIGCGNGLIASMLAEHAGQVFGVDTSKEHVELASRQFSSQENLKFLWLSPCNYLQVGELDIAKVTHVLCVSVLQYYRNLSEVETLIQQIKKVSKVGCVCIFADILTDYNIAKDIFGSIYGGIISNTLHLKILESIQNSSKKYTEMRKQSGLLMFDKSEFFDLCSNYGDVRIIKKRLSLNATRTHVALELR